ncbi:radical SAM protein [Polaromonas sp. LjRoot131]|uniref:radical SAM protein n=1 Tax=Polaromonas sp. LjRoot131 TaxID=3342262 RepID=UPI003ED009D0
MFRSAIVKLTAVCDIDCTYCYMFNQADQTFKRMPARMLLPTALRLLDRICDYHPQGEPEPFTIVLHGGEPMLWPDAGFAALLAQVALRREQGWNLDVAVQTNLVQPITPELLALFREHRVSLGVSLDGPREVNDAARVDRRGRGTYERVMANVKRMLADGDGALIGGFLSVANPSLPPAEFLAWVRSLPVPKVDVLWPIEFNWRNPPWTLGASHAYAAEPRYGAWYAELFRAWWALDDPGLTIRLFNNLLHVSLGGQGHIDALVNDSYNMFVVNTDGSYEYPDYLRVAGDGSASTPFHIDTDGIAVLAGDPLFARLLDLRAELPAKCEGCRHRRVCGGGFLPGRSDARDGIASRESVLCADQMHFFDAALGLIESSLQKRDTHVHSDPANAATGLQA